MTAMKNYDDPEQQPLLPKSPPPHSTAKGRPLCSRIRLSWLMAFIFLLTLSALFIAASGQGSPGRFRPTTPKLNVDDDVLENWAQYSPYVPIDDYDKPDHCEIDQVHILQRHGARFPTSGAGAKIVAAVNKLLSVSTYTDPRLNFLHNYTYDLGTDDLVPFGSSQSYDAGAQAFGRYSRLVTNTTLPFIRASSSDRVVVSAAFWAAGFGAASMNRYNPSVSVILDEALNDTLDDNMCPNAGSSDNQTNTWLAHYAPPITTRLNAAAPGANLTDVDIFNLISLCPFETVAKQTRSKWCDLFEDERGAFSGFEYSGDLDKYYGTGYGQDLGRVQGVGYINELLSRLTNTAVQDNTQTNHTLDSDPSTFPLNLTMYADFSHDNQMIAIYSAMGLFKPSRPLDPMRPYDDRKWRASHLVPFSARMVVERLNCRRGGLSVRVLVNDEVQPLRFCRGGSGSGGGDDDDDDDDDDDEGTCTLDAFVQSQSYAVGNGNGDFQRCFAAPSPPPP